MKYIIYFILIAVALFFIHKFLKQFKLCKIGSLVLFNGGVKCGKSTLSVNTAIREIKSRRRAVKIKNFFRRIFRKTPIEMPLLYSNVPLAFPYVPLTDKLLLRKERFVYGSVIYCQEASLVADSQLCKNQDINENLLLFNKLIGHETKGGVLIYDTQCISDLHYSIKRCLSQYIYVHHLVKWIPFILIAYVQENRYADDGTIIAVEDKDVEDKLKKVILSKRTWKYFDCYSYSDLTDNLPVAKDVVKNNLQTKNLKAYDIVSFRPNFCKIKGVKNEKENY